MYQLAQKETHPMTKLENGVMRYDQTESNKLAKQALQKAFPAVKFSIKAMSVEWIDGPTEKEVEQALAPFTGYVWDRSDIYADYPSSHSRDTEYQGQKCHFSFDPSLRREYSPAFEMPHAQQLAQQYGATIAIVPATKYSGAFIRFTPNYVPDQTPDDLSTLLWRIMKEISACHPPPPPPAPAPQPAPVETPSSRLTAEEYDAKRLARYERLAAAADRAENESSAHWEQAHKMASIIPFGQPILVGHHSEKRDRNYREKIERKHRKGYELHQKAEHLRERATAAQNNTAIFSDDPAATEKLADKIARLEARQELMKKANKLVRANDRQGLIELGFSERTIDQLFVPDYLGRTGFPDYAITNNGASIRAAKKRLVELEAKANATTQESTIGDVRIVENVEANRLQLFFPDKPDEATRTNLKSRGFRWTPSEGCWQAYLSNQSRYHVTQLFKTPTPPQPETPSAPVMVDDDDVPPFARCGDDLGLPASWYALPLIVPALKQTGATWAIKVVAELNTSGVIIEYGGKWLTLNDNGGEVLVSEINNPADHREFPTTRSNSGLTVAVLLYRLIQTLRNEAIDYQNF